MIERCTAREWQIESSDGLDRRLRRHRGVWTVRLYGIPESFLTPEQGEALAIRAIGGPFEVEVDERDELAVELDCDTEVDLLIEGFCLDRNIDSEWHHDGTVTLETSPRMTVTLVDDSQCGGHPEGHIEVIV